jgi:hypothetical protein
MIDNDRVRPGCGGNRVRNITRRDITGAENHEIVRYSSFDRGSQPGRTRRIGFHYPDAI